MTFDLQSSLIYTVQRAVSSVDAIRQRMISLLTEVALAQVEVLDPASPCAQELSKIPDVNQVIKEEIQRIFTNATQAEVRKIFFLTARIEKTSGQKREVIKNDLKKIVEALLARVEAESGALRLPQSCHNVLWDV